jgi:small subunit ribosomal protein S1
VAGFVNFGLEAPVDGHGLAGLFAPDLSDYYDGAVVPIAVGAEFVRVMLRDNGASCQLEVDGLFEVSVGYDQYMTVGSHVCCERAVAAATDLGLFPILVDRQPDDDEDFWPPADAAFWAKVADLLADRGTVLLQERPAYNLSRWHRLTAETVEGLQIAPRAMLSVWPELSTDVEAVNASADSLCEYVWEDRAGRIQSVVLSEPEVEGFPADPVSALVIPLILDDYNPLLEGALPDADGVLRARWPAS